MPDRTQAPPTGRIDKVDFARAEKLVLDNGLPLYVLRAGNDEVTRLEACFRAGSAFQPQLCVAAATNALIQEGTSHYSAAALADRFDFYGAFLQNACGIQEASYSLFTLNKHASSCVALFADMLQTASFPDAETAIYQNAQKQRLQISLQKNNVLARQAFFKALFGAEHILGRFATPDDYHRFEAGNLREYYQQTYQRQLPELFLSGKTDNHIINLVKQAFSKRQGTTPEPGPTLSLPTDNVNSGYIFREKPGSLQAAIRMGKITISRNHPDYLGLQLTNLIFGGYFGSRLMKNIREDKGLTYGIYSSVEPYKGLGVFSVSTEVNNKDHVIAVAEIKNELDRMCNELVPENELNKAKNYLLGSFVRNFDGPFAQMDRFKSLLDFDMDYSYYENYIRTVQSLTADDIKNLSIKYLNKNTMLTVVVGSDK